MLLSLSLYSVSQSCVTLCTAMDCNLSGSSIHGIFQARVLEWVAISFSRGFSHPAIEPRSPELQPDTLLSELPGKPLDGLILKLKLQYFGHLIWRDDSPEKTLMLGKIEGRRRRGWKRMRWLDGITNSIDMSLANLRELVMDRGLACCSSWGHKELDMTERLNGTKTNQGHDIYNCPTLYCYT